MQFYVLKPAGGRRFSGQWAYADQMDPVRVGGAVLCPVCREPVTMLRWLPPHRISLSSNRPDDWGDLLWGAGFLLMVSGRFKRIFESAGLTGITRFYPPAEIVTQGASIDEEETIKSPEYRLIEIAWNGANQDDPASGIQWGRPERIRCGYCRIGGGPRRQERIAVDSSTWSGDDIFTPRGAPVSIMVTEKFRRVAQQAHLTNYWCVPSSRYAYDDNHPGLWYINSG
jgi:hypothetical protein